VAPEDLGGQVAGARLRGGAGAGHHALQDGHDLEVGAGQRVGAAVEERAILVDHVADGDGPDDEDAVEAQVVADVQVELVEGQQLALVRHLLADHLEAHVRLGQVRLAHVADAELQAQLAVAHAHAAVAAEDERGGALLGPRQLGEHDARHQRLDDEPDHRLQADGGHQVRALLGRVPARAGKCSGRLCQRWLPTGSRSRSCAASPART